MLDPEKPVEELAAEVAQLPVGTDLSQVGLTPLLTGEGMERNPAKYAEIFRRAAEAANNSWTRLACEVEAINGRRRHSEAPLAEIASDLARVSANITSDLEPGMDKSLLVAGVDYNLGIILRNLRRCREAAQYQRQSASWYLLAGRVPQAMVGQFVAAVEDASAAIMSGDIAEMAQVLRHLRTMRELVRANVEPYPAWMVRSGTIHVWHAHFIAGLVCASLGTYDGIGNDFAEILRSPLEHWRQLAQVTQSQSIADAENALAAIGQTQSSSWGDVITTLQLVKALAHQKLGQHSKAAAELDRVIYWTGQGAGPVMAVARILHALV